jgi:hypothetical protein
MKPESIKKRDRTIEFDVKFNGLNVLDKFFKKHGNKIKLVGAFNLKPGDTLFFKSETPLSMAAVEKMKSSMASLLPGIKVVILDGLKLEGVATDGKARENI